MYTVYIRHLGVKNRQTYTLPTQTVVLKSQVKLFGGNLWWNMKTVELLAANVSTRHPTQTTLGHMFYFVTKACLQIVVEILTTIVTHPSLNGNNRKIG